LHTGFSMGNFIWVNDRSRMNREVHVRICESLEVKFLLATRLRGWNREVPPTRLLSCVGRTKDTSETTEKRCKNM